MPIGLLTFYRTGNLDELAQQQQLFGNRGLTRIRVRDDRESSTLPYLVNEFTICHNNVSG